MAEIVGSVSAAVTLSATSLHAIRALNRDLHSLKDAPRAIDNLKAELRSVQSVIETLRSALLAGDRQTALQGITQNGNVEAALKACNDSCGRFHKELREFLKYSGDGKLSKRDRFNIGFLARDRVVAFTNELILCTATLGLALNGANLIVAMEQYDQLQAIAKRGPTEMARGNARPEYDAADLATDIKQAPKLLKGYQEILGILQSKVEENCTRLKIGDVDMVDSKGAAGITNADGTEGHLDVNLGNVKTSNSKVVAGYSKKVDFEALFS